MKTCIIHKLVHLEEQKGSSKSNYKLGKAFGPILYCFLYIANNVLYFLFQSTLPRNSLCSCGSISISILSSSSKNYFITFAFNIEGLFNLQSRQEEICRIKQSTRIDTPGHLMTGISVRNQIKIFNIVMIWSQQNYKSI